MHFPVFVAHEVELAHRQGDRLGANPEEAADVHDDLRCRSRRVQVRDAADFLVVGAVDRGTDQVALSSEPPSKLGAAVTVVEALPRILPQCRSPLVEEVPFDRKLLAAAGVKSDRFGAPLAVSGDLLVVAAPSAAVEGRLFAGAAYVFQRNP